MEKQFRKEELHHYSWNYNSAKNSFLPLKTGLNRLKKFKTNNYKVNNLTYNTFYRESKQQNDYGTRTIIYDRTVTPSLTS